MKVVAILWKNPPYHKKFVIDGEAINKNLLQPSFYMQILGAIGHSNSGKTTTLTILVRELKANNFHVLIAKSMKDNIMFDTMGKDTWKYRQNSADFVVGKSPVDTALFLPPDLPVEQIIQIGTLLRVNFTILEGFKTYSCPRIICARSVEEIEEWLNEKIVCIAGPISKKLEKYKGIPIIDPLIHPNLLMDTVLAYSGYKQLWVS